MSESDRLRKRRRLMKGLLGPRFYQPRRPTRLQVLGRQFLIGTILWTVGVLLLGSLFGHSSLSIVAGVFAAGGWFALLWLNVRYFYYFVYRNDDADLKQQ